MNYIFFADGFETVEALAPVDMLRRAGLSVTTVSINGIWDVQTSQKVTVKADALFEELSYDDAEFLILPGGMPGSDNLRKHEELMEVVKKHAANGGKVAAICAAPYILGELGLLEGKKAVCYPGFEDRLKGAEVVDAKVVTDGNIVTGKGMGAAVEFGAAIIAELTVKELADKILNQIQY